MKAGGMEFTILIGQIFYLKTDGKIFILMDIYLGKAYIYGGEMEVNNIEIQFGEIDEKFV